MKRLKKNAKLFHHIYGLIKIDCNKKNENFTAFLIQANCEIRTKI